jgi:hypothetical protein
MNFLQLSNNYQTKMNMEQLLFLKWNKNDIQILDKKYLKLNIHTADDDENEIAFQQILYGGGDMRRMLLLKHIDMTTSVFGDYKLSYLIK